VAVAVAHTDADRGQRGTNSIQKCRAQAVGAAVVSGLQQLYRGRATGCGDARLDAGLCITQQNGAMRACPNIQDHAGVVRWCACRQTLEWRPQDRGGDPAHLQRVALGEGLQPACGLPFRGATGCSRRAVEHRGGLDPSLEQRQSAVVVGVLVGDHDGVR